eukprot:566333-Rhodomonas_salina.1
MHMCREPTARWLPPDHLLLLLLPVSTRALRRHGRAQTATLHARGRGGGGGREGGREGGRGAGESRLGGGGGGVREDLGRACAEVGGQRAHPVLELHSTHTHTCPSLSCCVVIAAADGP